MNLDYLAQDANKYFEEALTITSSKPEQAKKLLRTGHFLMLSFYLANNSPKTEEEIKSLLSLEIESFTEHPEKAYTSIQNDYALLCLSFNKPDIALKVLNFPADYGGYTPFPVLLNLKLRKLLGIEQQHLTKVKKISPSEQAVIDGFDAVIERRAVDWPSISAFWKSTKSKRFKNTIFEYNDLFSQALHNAERNLTHHSSGTG